MKRIYTIIMSLMLVLGISVSGHAALIDMGDGTIYDNDTQLSWLKNANTNGLMTWSVANTWATNLVFAGFNDWRLPTTLQPDLSCSTQSVNSYGNNCTGSEMGHLYYTELGNPAGGPLTNTEDFTNLQPGPPLPSRKYLVLNEEVLLKKTLTQEFEREGIKVILSGVKAWV